MRRRGGLCSWAVTTMFLILHAMAGQDSANTTDDDPTEEVEHTRYTMVRDFFVAREISSVALYACSLGETVQLVRALQNGPVPPRYSLGRNLDGVEQESAADGEDGARAGAYVNLACAGGWFAARTREVSGAVAWLARAPASPDPELEVDLAVDSDFTLASERADGDVELRGLYKAGDGCPTRSLYVGHWSPRRGLWLASPRASAVALRGDLCGAVFRAAVVLHQIAVGDDQHSLRRALQDHANTHMDTETRFGFALATHLADMYNFTLQLLVTPSWGYPRGNGTFDGMIGMLQRGEIEMGVTPAVITKERMAVADFTVQTWTLRTCFIFRHPRLLVPYKALSEPFAASTWSAVALVTASACAVLAAVRRCETAPSSGALSEAAVVVVGILSQQGSALDSRLVSGRTVLLAGLLLSVMLQSFYTSAIVTSLLTPIPRTIRTVHDLMRSPLKVGLEDYSYNRAVFPSSADPLTARLYRGKILPAWPEGGFFSVSDGVQRVRRGGFAFYSEDSSLYTPIQNTFSDDEKCSLSEVELNPAFVTAATLARRSPYKELFNRGLLLMLERGLRARQRRQWSAQRPSCEREAGAVAAVGLDPIFPAHAILLLGSLAALALLYAERRAAMRRSSKSP